MKAQILSAYYLVSFDKCVYLSNPNAYPDTKCFPHLCHFEVTPGPTPNPLSNPYYTFFHHIFFLFWNLTEMES